MSTTEQRPSRPAGDAHALLLSPSFEGRQWECCSSLHAPEPEPDASVITIAHTDTPEELAGRWNRWVDQAPKNFGVVFANSGMDDSRVLTRRLREAFDADDVMVGSAVVSPNDLTRMNIEVSEMLAMWDGEGERITLCISSLTTLLQYADVARAFRFLHATVNAFKSAAATTSTHYHLDPDAVDEQDVARVRSLMDEQVDLRPSS